MRLVVAESRLKQPHQVTGSFGAGARDIAERRRRVTQDRYSRVDIGRWRRAQVSQPPQRRELAGVGRSTAGDFGLRGRQVPVLGRVVASESSEASRSPLVVLRESPQGHAQRLKPPLHVAEGVLAVLPRGVQPLVRVAEIIQAEYRGEQVVQLRGPPPEERLEFGVRQERPVLLQVRVPAEFGHVSALLPRALQPGFRHGRIGTDGASRPGPRDRRLPAALDEELGRDLGVGGGVLGPPSLAHDDRGTRPAHQRAGEEYFKRFRETGLATPVPPDDQRQAWSRRDL
jgi:hypothetical protein